MYGGGIIINDPEKIKAYSFQIERYALVLAVVWTVVVATSLLWNVVQMKQETLEEARIQAQVAYEKDLIYRRWNAGHGGVYVPVTKETRPNPHLSDVPERDIITPSGKQLTLMNPAYMTRQAHELEKQKLGVRGHITSLNPIRPENASDPWEAEALRFFERGKTEISSVEKIEGKEYMRLMRPLITEKNCLKCHAKQGYHEGNIRGGISISIPMEPFRTFERRHVLTFMLAHGLLWLAGLSGIGLGTQHLKSNEEKRKQAEEALQKAHDELEKKVEERTADLTKANILLKQEITERKQAEEALQKSEGHLKLQFNRMPIACILWDREFRTVSWNPSAERIFGFTADEALCKNPYDFIVPKDTQLHVNTIWRRLLEGDTTAHSVNENITKDGRIIICEWSNTPLKEVDGTIIGVLSMVQDITERKQMEERLNYLAYYDDLTGIPNRNLFIDRLNQGISRNVHIKRSSAVLSVDIDRFKLINDTLGFDTGDAVLKEVAERLKISTRDGDTVARLGSDDFGVLLIHVANPDDVICVVEKVMKNVSQSINFKGKEIVLTLSVGVAVYPNDGNDSYTLMKNADLALSKAKQQGRKNYQFFTEDMDVKASEFVQMEKHLFNALQNKEYILHYQPYWDTTTKKIMGMEALVRWQSKDMGLVPPGKFIPVLEETKMIIEVGEWILKTAVGQVKEWQIKGYPVVPVSVNLSLIQFRQKDLAEMVKRIIAEVGFDPSLLTLEVTESAFMEDIELTSSVLKKFKDIGISISIDDFGTGYSSLSYLKRFPVDNLKIDISFIRDIVTDPDTASIVTAIIAMARTLNLKTIAEGVETEEQWNILRLLRCDVVQGFYFSKPLPAEDLEKLLI